MNSNLFNSRRLVLFLLFISSFSLNQLKAQDSDNDGLPDAIDNCPAIPNDPAPTITFMETTVVNGSVANSQRYGTGFNANNSIVVTQLGAFDDGQDGFNSPITVGIVDFFGTVVAGPVTFSGSGYSGVSSFRFQAITPVTLPAGEYTVVAFGYDANEQAGKGEFVFLTDGNVSPQFASSGGTGMGKPENNDGLDYTLAGNFRYEGMTPQFPDNDNDGQGDPCDTDDDNDGDPDTTDCDPLNAEIYHGATEQCNGVDDDCDGSVDEGFPDFDNDGLKDCIDPDADNDGIPDNYDCSPLNPSKSKWLICHNGHTICVAQAAVQAHLNHGDELGNCGTGNRSAEPELTTGVDKFKLSNAPNPATTATTIWYELPVASKVNIVLFDPMGRAIQTLVNESRASGQHYFNLNTSKLPAGIYYYRMNAVSAEHKVVQSNKLVIFK